MTEPLSPLAREIIRAAVASERPPHAPQRARIRRAVIAAALTPSVAAAAGGGTGLGAVTAGAAKVAAGFGLGSWGAKATALVVIGIGAGAAAIQLPAMRAGGEQVGPSEAAAIAVAAPIASSERAASAPPAFPPPPAPSAVAAPARPAATPAPARGGHSSLPVPDGELRAELAELEQVQAHLRAGRGEAALELLDARSAEGMLLGEERLASEVLAACQAGQVERARRAARAFLARAPSSLLADQVGRSCAFAAEETAGASSSRH